MADATLPCSSRSAGRRRVGTRVALPAPPTARRPGCPHGSVGSAGARILRASSSSTSGSTRVLRHGWRSHESSIFVVSPQGTSLLFTLLLGGRLRGAAGSPGAEREGWGAHRSRTWSPTRRRGIPGWIRAARTTATPLRSNNVGYPSRESGPCPSPDEYTFDQAAAACDADVKYYTYTCTQFADGSHSWTSRTSAAAPPRATTGSRTRARRESTAAAPARLARLPSSRRSC